MDEEFGAGYARTVARDQVVAALGGRTAEQALAAHVPPRDVWLALCEAMDVPREPAVGTADEPCAPRAERVSRPRRCARSAPDPDDHRKSMALFDSRTQPCEAG